MRWRTWTVYVHLETPHADRTEWVPAAITMTRWGAFRKQAEYAWGKSTFNGHRVLNAVVAKEPANDN